jgi:hypothetical protein
MLHLKFPKHTMLCYDEKVTMNPEHPRPESGGCLPVARDPDAETAFDRHPPVECGADIPVVGEICAYVVRRCQTPFGELEGQIVIGRWEYNACGERKMHASRTYGLRRARLSLQDQ